MRKSLNPAPADPRGWLARLLFKNDWGSGGFFRAIGVAIWGPADGGVCSPWEFGFSAVPQTLMKAGSVPMNIRGGR